MWPVIQDLHFNHFPQHVTQAFMGQRRWIAPHAVFQADVAREILCGNIIRLEVGGACLILMFVLQIGKCSRGMYQRRSKAIQILERGK